MMLFRILIIRRGILIKNWAELEQDQVRPADGHVESDRRHSELGGSGEEGFEENSGCEGKR